MRYKAELLADVLLVLGVGIGTAGLYMIEPRVVVVALGAALVYSSRRIAR